MPDDAQNILSPVQVDNSIKANAWEVFNSAKNENDLGVRLQGINLPQETKAQLWEAKKKAAVVQPAPPAYPEGTMQRYKGGPLVDPSGVPITAKPTGMLPSRIRGGLPQGEPDVQGTLGALPWLGGGAAAALSGGSGLIYPALMATGGGMLGEHAKQGIEKAAGERAQLSGEEIAKTGMKVGGTELLGGAAEKYVLSPLVKFGGRQIAKLFGETPERIAELKALPQQEAALNQKIAQAEQGSRAAFKDAYPKIDAAPVNLQETRAVAKQAAEQLKAYPSPRPLSQVSDIPMPTERQVASQIAPEVWHPETILDRLGKFDNVPFREAQQYRTAIEQYISRARPPAAVYNALKNVSNSLESVLEATASREGVLPQFQNANAMFKQHAADFWNKTAPLKPFANIPPNATGATVNRFLQTAQQGRALEALERRLGPQPELRAILAKGSKAVKVDFRDAATLKNLGEPALNQQVAGARQAALKSKAIKAGVGALGGATLYEMSRALSAKKPQ